MKALRFVSALLIVAAFAGSCIKDEMIENAPAGSHTVTISANFSDFTKTLISEDSEGHYKALWEAGDVICVTEIVTGTSLRVNLILLKRPLWPLVEKRLLLQLLSQNIGGKKNIPRNNWRHTPLITNTLPARKSPMTIILIISLPTMRTERNTSR